MGYAVIDTNVLVSAMLTQNKRSATFQVMEAMFANIIIPLFNEEIISEYEDVLQRAIFPVSLAGGQRGEQLQQCKAFLNGC